MKTYDYIHKVYLLGLVLYHITIAWGAIALADVLVSPWGIVYLVMYLLLLRDYLSKYLYYRKKSLVVSYEGMGFNLGEEKTFYPREQIKAIIYARHLVNFKIHQVIHVFLQDGDHRIVLYDLQNFNGFKEHLKQEYRPFYKEKQTLIKGQINDYDELLHYEYNQRRAKAWEQTAEAEQNRTKRKYREPLPQSSEN